VRVPLKRTPTNVAAPRLAIRYLSDARAGKHGRKLSDMTADIRHTIRRARLIIADDRARTRRALSAILSTQTGLELVGEAADGEETLTAVERLQPDIVIIDIRMARLDGIAATAQIKARWPGTRVIAHSLAEEFRPQALAAGADAFVPKSAPVRDPLDVLGTPAQYS